MWDEPKEKKRSSFPLLVSIWPSFDFLSPLPLEQCVTRLAGRSERKPDSGFNPESRKLSVEVFPQENGGSYRFKLNRRFTFENVEVVGELSPYNANSTAVSGHARLIPTSEVLILFSVFLIGFITTPAFREGLQLLLWLLMLTLFLVITRFRVRIIMKQMIKVVYDTLSDQIF